MTAQAPQTLLNDHLDSNTQARCGFRFRTAFSKCSAGVDSSRSGLSGYGCSYVRATLRYRAPLIWEDGVIDSNWRLVPAIVARKLAGAMTPLPEIARPGISESGRTLFQAMTFLFVVIGVASGFGQRFRNVRLVLTAAVLAYLVMAVATFPTLRYRAPLIWIELLCLLTLADPFVKRFLGRGMRRQRV